MSLFTTKNFLIVLQFTITIILVVQNIHGDDMKAAVQYVSEIKAHAITFLTDKDRPIDLPHIASPQPVDYVVLDSTAGVRVNEQVQLAAVLYHPGGGLLVHVHRDEHRRLRRQEGAGGIVISLLKGGGNGK